ncbi:MAG: AAA family ATPase [Deltaproteobacteria bacterium]|nr:AAA family ATPase [Deltaproteobacteria bacterium]
MKKLPIGIQTFRKLIDGNYLYLDKTEYIYKLLVHGSAYFLSRPRRFGKSLLISTLNEIFEGERSCLRGCGYIIRI